MEAASVTYHLRGNKGAVPETPGLRRIKQVYPGIEGFPLCFEDSVVMPYTSDSESNPIIRRIRETRLHDRRNEGNLYALAVHIHPYPNRIGACWVYIASLPPTSTRQTKF